MIRVLEKDGKFVSIFKERPFGVVNRIHVWNDKIFLFFRTFETRMKFFKAPAGYR